jgi:hypothetical protein
MAGYPNLLVNPTSGLTFPWADWTSKDGSTSNIRLGQGGVSPTMIMILRWVDLVTSSPFNAVQQLIGYSQRIASTVQISQVNVSDGNTQVQTVGPHGMVSSGPRVSISGVPGGLKFGSLPASVNGVWNATRIDAQIMQLISPNYPSLPNSGSANGGIITQSYLTRKLPFQNPQWPGVYCLKISDFKGIQQDGTIDDGLGPFSAYSYALLTLEFGIPPYQILQDYQILDANGYQQEWLRYTDRLWTPNIQMLSRLQGNYKFAEGAARGISVPQGVGSKVAKIKYTRKWYQIPEQGIYNSLGFPQNLLQGVAASSASIPNVASSTIAGCVNVSEPLNVSPDGSFMGCAIGTLLYELPEIIPQPLPLPWNLMNIVSPQQFPLQYDVIFHFEYFDPPLGTGNPLTLDPKMGGIPAARGHNLLPWTNDSRWYLVTSQNGTRTIFDYYPFSNLFQIC